MNLKILQQGNDLNNKIRACEEALDCFQYDSNPKNWTHTEPVEHPIWKTTNPKIIIEYDGPDGREQTELPFMLNDELIELLKTHIIKERDKYQTEFNNL